VREGRGAFARLEFGYIVATLFCVFLVVHGWMAIDSVGQEHEQSKGPPDFRVQVRGALRVRAMVTIIIRIRAWLRFVRRRRPGLGRCDARQNRSHDDAEGITAEEREEAASRLRRRRFSPAGDRQPTLRVEDTKA